MPQRRGLRGGAEQGLGTLSQILASLLQNRMTGERQQEIISAQNEAISEREDARVAEARARMGLDPNASPQEVAEVIRQQNQQKASVEASQQAAEIPLDESGGMTGLLEAFRAAPPGSPQKQAIGRRLASRGFQGGPAPPPGTSGGNAPTPVPSLQGAQRLGDLQRSTEFEDEARSAEASREPIDSAAERARRTAEASRRTPEQIEADAAAQARGTAAGTPASGGTVTEGQRTAAAFYNTANQKREIIRDFNDRLFSDSAFATTQRILPNMLRSADMQSYLKILESIAFDITVGTSGAQFSANELQRRIDQITPEVGDRRETIEAKMAILESGLDALRQKAGGAVEPESTPPPEDAGAGMSDADLRELASSPDFTEADAALLTPEEQQRLRQIRSGG